jgi:protein-tyrosine phosphatase
MPVMENIWWAREGVLARANAPGFPGRKVPRSEIEEWIQEAKAKGLRSIICLLNEELSFYAEATGPGGLLEAYRRAGFAVFHVPVSDHRYPVLSDDELARGLEAFRQAERPVVVHCFAGLSRTGTLVGHILQSWE